MALMKCKQCGGSLSTHAVSCPHCEWAPAAELIEDRKECENDTSGKRQVVNESYWVAEQKRQDNLGTLKVHRDHADDLIFAKVAIWGKVKDEDSWHRYCYLDHDSEFEAQLDPDTYTFRACVGLFFDEENDDHKQGDDVVDVNITIEPHQQVDLDIHAWGNLYVSILRRK